MKALEEAETKHRIHTAHGGAEGAEGAERAEGLRGDLWEDWESRQNVGPLGWTVLLPRQAQKGFIIKRVRKGPVKLVAKRSRGLRPEGSQSTA